MGLRLRSAVARRTIAFQSPQRRLRVPRGSPSNEFVNRPSADVMTVVVGVAEAGAGAKAWLDAFRSKHGRLPKPGVDHLPADVAAWLRSAVCGGVARAPVAAAEGREECIAASDDEDDCAAPGPSSRAAAAAFGRRKQAWSGSRTGIGDGGGHARVTASDMRAARSAGRSASELAAERARREARRMAEARGKEARESARFNDASLRAQEPACSVDPAVADADWAPEPAAAARTSQVPAPKAATRHFPPEALPEPGGLGAQAPCETTAGPNTSVHVPSAVQARVRPCPPRPSQPSKRSDVCTSSEASDGSHVSGDDLGGDESGSDTQDGEGDDGEEGGVAGESARAREPRARPRPAPRVLAEVSVADLPGLTVAELKMELKMRSMPQSGRRAELVERLTAAIEGRALAPTEPRTEAVSGAGSARGPAPLSRNFVRFNLKKPKQFKSGPGGGLRLKRKSKFRAKPLSQPGVGVKGRLGAVNALEEVSTLAGRDVAPRLLCFACGQPGHFAHSCPNRLDDAGLPAAEADGADAAHRENGQDAPSDPASAPGGPLAMAAPGREEVPGPQGDAFRRVRALAESVDFDQPGGVSEADLLPVLQGVFGHGAFRPGQVAVLRRVLSPGSRTLAVLPTGSGKSLLYQLPAALGRGMVVVVSPLTALMRDQVRVLPPGLRGAMLGGAQRKDDYFAALVALQRGDVDVLFMAPERLQSPYTQRILQAVPEGRRPSLLVVDEAHCITEWGHNFRPAYLRVGLVAASLFPQASILALTATATRATEVAICAALGVPNSGVVRDASLPANLRLHVERIRGDALGADARGRLTWLLTEGPLRERHSVLVYASLKQQADDLAKHLYVSGVPCLAYHAGKAPQERARVESLFAAGKLRCVVATVAFGMGVNVPHVGGVVHVGAPRSLEEYVQQVGRAGRSGSEEHCWLLLSDPDFVLLRSLAFSDGADAASVRGVLEAILRPEGRRASAGSVRVLPVEKLCPKLDVKAEVVETLLSFLEATPAAGYAPDATGPLARVLPGCSERVDVSFYVAPREVAAESEVARAVLECSRRASGGRFSCGMADLCAALGCDPVEVVRGLAELAGVLPGGSGEAEGRLRFEMAGGEALACQVAEGVGPLSDVAMERLARDLHRRLQDVETGKVARMDAVYRVMAAAADAGDPSAAEALLRREIDQYFERRMGDESLVSEAVAGMSLPVCSKSRLLAADAAVVIQWVVAGNGAAHRDHEAWRRPEAGGGARSGRGKRADRESPSEGADDDDGEEDGDGDLPQWLTARVVARAMHGLASPAFAPAVWSRAPGWGTRRDVDFDAAMRAAQVAIEAARGRKRARVANNLAA